MNKASKSRNHPRNNRNKVRPVKNTASSKNFDTPQVKRLVYEVSKDLLVLLQRPTAEILLELDQSYENVQSIFFRILGAASAQSVSGEQKKQDLQDLSQHIGDIPAILTKLAEEHPDQLWHYQKKFLELLQRMHVEVKFMLLKISKSYSDSTYRTARKHVTELDGYTHSPAELAESGVINNVHHLDKRLFRGPSFPNMLILLSQTIHDALHDITDDTDREVAYKETINLLYRSRNPAKQHAYIGTLADMNDSINDIYLERLEHLPEFAHKLKNDLQRSFDSALNFEDISLLRRAELKQLEILDEQSEDFREALAKTFISAQLSVLPLYLENVERFFKIERLSRAKEAIHGFMQLWGKTSILGPRGRGVTFKFLEKTQKLCQEFLESPFPAYKLSNREDSIESDTVLMHLESVLHRGRFAIPGLMAELDALIEKYPDRKQHIEPLLDILEEVRLCLPVEVSTTCAP